MRWERPCKCCVTFGDPENPCKRYVEWRKRNKTKQALMRPVDVSILPEQARKENSCVHEDMLLSELEQLIDMKLPLELRSDYIRMRSGVQISLTRRVRVQTAVTELLKGTGYAH